MHDGRVTFKFGRRQIAQAIFCVPDSRMAHDSTHWRANTSDEGGNP